MHRAAAYVCKGSEAAVPAMESEGQELLAATALAGLATGLRPSGFEQAPERPPAEGVTPG